MSPTYQNKNKIRKEVNGKVIEPNEKLESFQYLNENECELIETDVCPIYNPTLLSLKIDENREIQIPKYDTLKTWISKYNIHFYVEKGEVEIWYNSKTNTPPLVLYNQCKWNVRCLTRTIDKLIINATSHFILWIEIERIQ